MSDLERKSDLELKSEIKMLASSERKITAQIVSYIAEVDRRKSYLKWGYPSLFEFLITEPKYSAAAAYRRIQAARALRVHPSLIAKLEGGEIKLSQVAAVQTALRQVEKSSGQKFSKSKVSELYVEIENKTTFETERILRQQVFREDEGVDESVHLSLKLSKETFLKLQRAKELLAHKDPCADWGKVLDMVLEDSLNKRDPLRKLKVGSEAEVKNRFGLQRKGRRAIAKSVRQLVHKRDQGKCQYKSRDGKVCGSPFLIELDHIQPVSHGGGNEMENLRTLCRGHNQLAYEEFETG